LSGGSYVDGIGGGAYFGEITCEHVGSGRGEQVKKNIRIMGVSIGPQAKTDGLGIISQIFGNKILGKLFNSGAGKADLPSETIGPVAPLMGRPLTRSDFDGRCAMVFLSGGLFAGGPSVYLLLFGAPVQAASARGTSSEDGLFAYKGVAEIFQLGFGFGIGISGNYYTGTMF
jgi:hypothetical protein